MKFTIGAPKPVSEIPLPASRAPRGQMEPVFEKLCALKPGQALPLTFESDKAALAAGGALRKIAQREGEFLSSSWGEGRKTIFLWIEPKEAIAELKAGKPK